MSISDDLAQLEQALQNLPDLEIIESLWALTDHLIEEIEEQLGPFNAFDITVGRLKLVSRAMLPVTRRLKTAT
jgi:hypothetical protein